MFLIIMSSFIIHFPRTLQSPTLQRALTLRYLYLYKYSAARTFFAQDEQKSTSKSTCTSTVEGVAAVACGISHAGIQSSFLFVSRTVYTVHKYLSNRNFLLTHHIRVVVSVLGLLPSNRSQGLPNSSERNIRYRFVLWLA